MTSSDTPDHGRGSVRRRWLFLGISLAAVIGILVAFREILAPFALALVVAYVFAPLVERLETVRLGKRPVPRWAAVLTIYIALLAVLAGSIAFGVPLLLREMTKLGREVPTLVERVQTEWIPWAEERIASIQSAVHATDEATSVVVEEVGSVHVEVRPLEAGGYEVVLPPRGLVVTPTDDGSFVIAEARREEAPPTLVAQLREALGRQTEQGEHTALAALRTAQSIVGALVNGIFKFFIMLMLSAYLLITRQSIIGFFRTLVVHSRRAQFDEFLERLDRGLSGVVRGQLVICLVNGILSGIGFWLVGLDYWPLLTLIATLLSIIPIFGAILSSVPAVIVGLQQGPGVALFTLAWIIGIHQVEANLLNPKIMGDAAKVHPVLVVFALIAGEHFFGILGALLAVPVLSITQTLFLFMRELALGVPASTSLSGVPAELLTRTGETTLSGTEAPPSDGP